MKYNAGGMGKGHTISLTYRDTECGSSLLYAMGGEQTALVRNHLLSDTAKEKTEMSFQAHFFSAVFCLFPSLKIIVFNFPISFAG